MSLGRLCSNSLITSAATTSRNLTPAPWGSKIVCKRALFFDHGWAGYLTYLGFPHLHVNRPLTDHELHPNREFVVNGKQPNTQLLTVLKGCHEWIFRPGMASTVYK